MPDLTRADEHIRKAILEQLPRAYADYPVWWPLIVAGQEYRIKGRLIVTLAEFERQLTLRMEVLCAF